MKRPEDRVSPTAPERSSVSAMFWRLLEANEEFRRGMAEAKEDFEAGRAAPFKHRAPRPRRCCAGCR
jgi:hypothetical protein